MKGDGPSGGQHPLMRGLPGGASPEALHWDAEFEVWLARTISDRLASCPPPSGSLYGAPAREWSENLWRSGRERQEALGLDRLRVVR